MQQNNIYSDKIEKFSMLKNKTSFLMYLIDSKTKYNLYSVHDRYP